jgi:hypothetical protein
MAYETQKNIRNIRNFENAKCRKHPSQELCEHFSEMYYKLFYVFLSDSKMKQLPVRRQPMSLSSQTGLVILEKLHESGSKYFTLIWLLRRNTDTLIFHKFLIT